MKASPLHRKMWCWPYNLRTRGGAGEEIVQEKRALGFIRHSGLYKTLRADDKAVSGRLLEDCCCWCMWGWAKSGKEGRWRREVGEKTLYWTLEPCWDLSSFARSLLFRPSSLPVPPYVINFFILYNLFGVAPAPWKPGPWWFPLHLVLPLSLTLNLRDQRSISPERKTKLIWK